MGKMLVRSGLVSTVAYLALSASPAIAQSSLPSKASTVPPSVGNAASDNPGDIVVTAQRRKERLQQVPLSITAINGEDIRKQDITDVSRLVQVVPGLRLGRSGAAERPAIRGVYTEAIGLNSDPRIGFYIDEIY